jgi:hypothetical protein
MRSLKKFIWSGIVDFCTRRIFVGNATREEVVMIFVFGADGWNAKTEVIQHATIVSLMIAVSMNSFCSCKEE